VRDGHFSPAPLTIKLAARIHRISLAGIDGFRPDAVAYGEHLKALCREHGFVGIYPLDGNAPPSLTPNEKARWIYRANIDALTGADAVMANLNDFRGPAKRTAGLPSRLASLLRSESPYGDIARSPRRFSITYRRLWEPRALSVATDTLSRTSE